MTGKPGSLRESPSQTAGPYLHIGCMPNAAGIAGIYPADPGHTLKRGPVAGQDITVQGCVFDGDGAPLTDALVEIWQADAAGLYPGAGETRGPADPNFTGWGRCASNAETGLFTFDTVKPGPVPWPDGRMQAPHITVWIAARGINIGLQTRLYFADEAKANLADPVLSALPDPARIETLLAVAEKPGQYRFDIRLQGAGETIFFDM